MNPATPGFQSCLITALFSLATLAPLAIAQAPAAPADSVPDTPAPIHSSTAHINNTQFAWSTLEGALNDNKDQKHTDLRTQSLAALGTMGTNSHAATLIGAATNDADIDVRTAAILAAGQSKDRALIPALRTKLDDKEPQVAFAAAITLSKLGDRTGEDILMDVVNGERKAGAGLVSGGMHTMSKDLHNPSSIAKIGALQGASMLLGPFGFGITAYEYLHKNGGASARVTAIEELSKVKSQPIHKQLLDALDEKDPAIRATAAKALGDYHDKATATALFTLLEDPKAPVRLTAAAAYIRCTVGVSTAKNAAPPGPKR